MEQSSFQKACKTSIKKIQSSANGEKYAFYLLLDHTKKYYVYIDRLPGKKYTRFQTPKLIHEHVQKSKISNDGIGSTSEIKKCKSCSGFVEKSGEDLRFVIKSKAGKAGYSELKKGLKKSAFCRIFPSVVFGVEEEGASETDAIQSSEAETLQAAMTTNLEEAYRQGSLSVLQLGENITKLQEYLDANQSTLGASKIAELEQLIGQMETLYGNIEEGGTDPNILKSSEELKGAALQESADMERIEDECNDLSDKLASLEDNVHGVSEIISVIDNLNKGNFPPAYVESMLAKIPANVLNSSPRLQSMVTMLHETHTTLSDFTNIADITSGARSAAVEKTSLAARNILQGIGESDDGIFWGSEDKTLDKAGAHLGVISAYLSGGKQAAIYAGKMCSIASQLKGAKLSTKKNLEAKAQVVMDAHGSFSKEGEDFLEGITYLANAGFMTEGTLELKGEFLASFGPLHGRINGLLRLYSKAGGELDAKATISLLRGIDIQGSIHAGAIVEARAEVSASIHLSSVATLDVGAYAHAIAGAEAHAEGVLVITPNGAVQIKGKIGGTIGAKAEAGLTFNLKDEQDKSILDLGLQVGAIAGLSAELGGSFSLEGGKLVLEINIAAALGFGGSAKVQLEVDLQAMFEKLVLAINKRYRAVIEQWWDDTVRYLNGGFDLLNDQRGIEAGLFVTNKVQYSKEMADFIELEVTAEIRDFIEPSTIKTACEVILESKDLSKEDNWYGTDETKLRMKVEKYANLVIKAYKPKNSQSGYEEISLYSSAFDSESPSQEEACIAIAKILQYTFVDLCPTIQSVYIRIDHEKKTASVASITAA